MKVVEGKARISAPDGVFFNPHMRLCRDIASLWVGTLGEVKLLDGFCASGARGIRYVLENKNVKSAVFVDMSKKSISACKKNITANKIGKKAKAVNADIRKFLLGNGWGKKGADGGDAWLVELDPFGSPAPYLHDALRFGNKRGVRYLSATATDMAVLCGAHFGACVKNYSSRPLDNEFCHENAVRILLARISREASAENWGMDVELALSHRHYVKVFVKLAPGAEKAVETAKLAMMHVSFCRKCGWRKLARLPDEKCGNCKNKNLEWAGPMWGGKIFDRGKIAQMMELAEKKKNTYSDEALKLLATVLDEADGPEFYYDLHEMAGRGKKPIPRINEAIESLRKAGFFASRTHFSPTSIRTDAGLGKIINVLEK